MKLSRTLPLLTAEDHTDDETEGDEPQDQSFELPENLADLADEQLAELEAEAMSAFDAIRQTRLTPESIQTLSDLTSAVEALRNEAADRIDAAQDLADQAAVLAERVAAPDDIEAVDETPAPEADSTPEGGAPEGEPAISAEGGDETGGGDTPDEPTTEAEPVAVAAAAAAPARRKPVRIPLGAIRQQAPPAPVDAGTDRVAMVAAAEIHGVGPNGSIAAGARFTDTRQVAEAMHAKARHLGNGQNAPIATITRPMEHVITKDMDSDAQQAIIASAIAPARGGYEALVAAGGWCAPNQVLYDLFSMESTDGLYTMPSVGVDRGGMDFPLASSVPTLADVFGTDALWVWTEQNDIDAHTPSGDEPTKPCAVIPCVEFDSERLDGHGVCLTHGNLADIAYPELTAQYVNLVMAAHEHSMSVRRLARVVADSSPVTMDAVGGDAFSAVVGASEVQVLDIRDKYRMNTGTLMEAVFPMWVKAVIRSSLSKRTGVDLLSVTDAQIEAAFALRGIRPQFVYNWQSLQTSSDGEDTDEIVSDGGGDGNESTQYPNTVDFLVYPAGTWVWGSGRSINLLVVRDSVLNATNDHTAVFTEEFHLIAQRGPESRIVTVGLDPSGETGSADITAAQF